MCEAEAQISRVRRPRVKLLIRLAVVLAVAPGLPARSMASPAGTIAHACWANSTVVNEAISLHKQRATVVSLESLADRAGSNERLHDFLLESIHVATKTPAYIQQLVENGEWQRQCIAYVSQKDE